jgi:hypothetical protein
MGMVFTNELFAESTYVFILAPRRARIVGDDTVPPFSPVSEHLPPPSQGLGSLLFPVDEFRDGLLRLDE